jgi:hypothetical protein
VWYRAIFDRGPSRASSHNCVICVWLWLTIRVCGVTRIPFYFPYFDGKHKKQCALLYNRLAQANLISPPPDVTATTNREGINDNTNTYRQEDPQGLAAAAPRRVFQILANSPARRAVFSWPTEGCDANEFGNLASNVRIDTPAQSATASPASSSSITSPSPGSPPQNTAAAHEALRYQHRQQKDPDSPYAEVRTSCTRRYKSQQSFQSKSVLHEVESIFIPHGSVIFACHQVINRRPIVPSFDTLVASSSTAPAFRPHSQQWTLKPSPLALHSLSTDNERHIKRYPISSSDFPGFSPSRATPTSASTLSSGYPITPASSDNREWHDWHLDTTSGFLAGVHNPDPKSEPLFLLMYPVVAASFSFKKVGRDCEITMIKAEFADQL